MTRIQDRIDTRSLAVVLMASAALAACATPAPRYAARMPNGGFAAAGPVTAAAGVPNGAGGRYKIGAPYQVAGIWYVPKEEPNYDQQGVASWYGDDFHLKPTANGEIFDMGVASAAHPTLPLPSIVEVTNLDNGRKIKVRVNDRGPFIGGRVIDLSREAAHQLDYDRTGTANVRVRYVGPAELGPPDPGLRYAAYTPTATTSATLPAGPIAYTGLPPATPVTSTALPTLQPVKTAAAGAGTYRVQAGAFSDPGNAQRVANQLAGAGAATIEPVQRADGVTLYRVMLAGGADEGEAWNMRDRVAAYGFAEARVVRPF